jgi:hypothetical protein
MVVSASAWFVLPIYAPTENSAPIAKAKIKSKDTIWGSECLFCIKIILMINPIQYK